MAESTIKDGSKVRFHYTLTVDDQVIDSSTGGDPLSYVHGQGEIVPGLEQQLEGLGTGDTATAVVPPEDGYGQPDPAGLQEVPRGAFEQADKLRPGDIVAGEANGQPVRASIREIKDETVVVDLNHPLAGKTLHFAVEVVEID